MRREIGRGDGRRALDLARSCAAGLAVCLMASVALAQESPARPPVTRGRLTVSLANYMECANEYAFVRGERVVLSGGDFLPNESVAVTMETDAGELTVGTVRATPRGGLSATVAIPASAPTEGEVHLRASADKGEMGGGVALRSPPLRIFPDTRDSDGDGIQDRCDTCPNLKSDNLADSDGDGIGDACDKCPNDSDNDSDGDGLCADVDPNPYAPDAAASHS